jgi:hypothetical protein
VSSSATVLIAAPNLIAALKAKSGTNGPVLTFADTEPLLALEAIAEHRPRMVVLERLFAATPRGAALINRIKADPTLSEAEIHVLSHDSDYARVVSRRAETAAAPSPTPAPAANLDWHGTRRAQRFRIQRGIEVQVDGNPAMLIDLSTYGAQVVSTAVLRPNQRVRMLMSDDQSALRVGASIAWAKFELPKGTAAASAQYRAGLEFADADFRGVDAFCSRHRDRT